MDNYNLQQLEQFYNIPGYSRYVLSKTGSVINKFSGAVLSGSKNPDGYINYRLIGDDGKTLTWGRHRLMCYVFKPNLNSKQLVVNHENAIKGDDRLGNLEWTTYQGNIEHAGAMGLTEKCMPISVRDVYSEEVFKFPSIIECARAFGLTKDAVSYRVSVGEQRVFPECKQYRIGHSDRPWFLPEDLEKALLLNGTCKNVQMRCLETGYVSTYNKLTDLSIALEVSLPTITLWLSKENQPVLPGFIQLKLGSDLTPWREVKDLYLEHDQSTGKRSVKIINSRTGEVKMFTSAIECAHAMGINPTALNHRLKSNGKKVFKDGFMYSYYGVQ